MVLCIVNEYVHVTRYSCFMLFTPLLRLREDQHTYYEISLFLFAVVDSADDHLFLAKNSCILYGEEN
jgi:hypothetical protein